MDDLIYTDLERRRADVEQVQENSGRMAEAFARFKSVGQGSIQFDERVDFDVTFIEEPYFRYGSYLDVDELENLLDNDQDAGTPPFPVCSGFVTDWDQDDRGFYVGAWVAVRVWFPYEANIWPELPVEIMHHFSFTAVAIKDVPTDIRD